MADMANTIQPLQDALVASITPGQIVGVLAAMVGVGMTFVLMWFGVIEKSVCLRHLFVI